MDVFTITVSDKESFRTFFSQDSYENIGRAGYFTMAAIDDEDFVAGVLQFYVTEDFRDGITAKVTYLHVDEDFRNQGVATALLEAFKDVAAESGISKVTAEVFTDIDNEFKSILEEEGFAKECEVSYFNLPLINCVKKLSKVTTDTGNCKSLEELSGKEQKQFLDDINPVILRNGLKGYEMKVSSYLNDGDTKCLFLVKNGKDYALEVVFSYASKGSRNSLFQLLLYSADKAMELYGPSCPVQVSCKDDFEYELVSLVASDTAADKYNLYVCKLT